MFYGGRLKAILLSTNFSCFSALLCVLEVKSGLFPQRSFCPIDLAYKCNVSTGTGSSHVFLMTSTAFLQHFQQRFVNRLIFQHPPYNLSRCAWLKQVLEMFVSCNKGELKVRNNV